MVSGRPLSTGRRNCLDILTIALCLSIGNMVAWLLALYTQGGIHQLLWNVVFASAGAFLSVAVVAFLAPDLRVAGLVVAGPFFALMAIGIGQILTHSLLPRAGKDKG